MTRMWTVYTLPVFCDHPDGPHQIPAGQPVRVVSGMIRRCEAHAHVPVDWTEVDKARHAIETARLLSSSTPGAAAPTRRMPPVRQPVPLAQVAEGLPFDPRAAAAGDRD